MRISQVVQVYQQQARVFSLRNTRAQPQIYQTQMMFFIIIETDLDGKFCSCFPTISKAVAEEMVARYKSGKQGHLHKYKIETHYLG